MGDLHEVYFKQMGGGKDSRYRQGDYVLVSGQEDPRIEIHEQGHAIALNIREPVRDTARYHLYNVVFDTVHAQGGFAGYAHFAWAPAYARPIFRFVISGFFCRTVWDDGSYLFYRVEVS